MRRYKLLCSLSDGFILIRNRGLQFENSIRAWGALRSGHGAIINPGINLDSTALTYELFHFTAAV
jgi:hypothetical protein